jgi:hypothetical protein
MRENLKLLTVVVLAQVVLAQGPNQPAPPAPAPVAAKPVVPIAPAGNENAFLKIAIEPSRSPITMDTEAGVSAEIKNVSSAPVKLYENETVFVTTPEILLYGDTQQSIRGCATFPTQGNTPPVERPARGYGLLIQPGESYRVFWDMTKNGCAGKSPEEKEKRFSLPWLEHEWQKIMFSPGTYKVYLDAVFYPSGQDGQPYHTAAEGRDVVFSASEQKILFGAFLGGLLAYIIKVYYNVPTQLTAKMKTGWLKRYIGYTEWIAAGLFGAIIVILASRLSDSFPVKVNANDFWGSITLGFVFQWMGVKLLEKLPGMGAAKNPPAPPAQGDNPGPPAPQPPA